MADRRPTSSVSNRAAPGAPPPSGFARLGLSAPLVDALAAAGISEPFPIQTATVPDALAGRDILCRARTGSGKTLAFVLPVLARLASIRRPPVGCRPRALIVAPTRELARQIHQVIEPLASVLGLRATTVFGGVPVQPQVSALRRGVEIVVACPGRLEDLLRSGACRLGDIEITVLDEADHMADLGFLPAVRRIVDQTPAHSQKLLYSATLDTAVDVLVRRYLSNPVVHHVDDDRASNPEMAHHVLHISAGHRVEVLVDLTSTSERTVVFTRTKHRARVLARQLVGAGVPAVEMHSNLNQTARVRNLSAFSSGRANVLVATDIAARGLHIDDVDLVIHADPPLEHKAYLHRSGRTGRAGAGGTVVTLATEDQRADVARLGKRAGVTAAVTQHRPGQPSFRHILAQPKLVADNADRSSTADGQPGSPSPTTTNHPKQGRRRKPRMTSQARDRRARSA
jgi:superfamily II DNA/RNA helicase